MTFQIGLVLLIVVVAVALFATEKIRADLIALLVLLSLVFTGLIDEQTAFQGFASPAVVTVWAVYIVSGGLLKTGVADAIGERILQLVGRSEARIVSVLMATCGSLSAFMNNIGATAMLMPATFGISRETKIPVSKLLIPLAFASLLGGNMTLIGTPPNILAGQVLAAGGLEPFGFFDFLPTGIIVFVTGIAFMAVFGRRLLPARSEHADPAAHSFDWRRYLCEVRVAPTSPLVAQTLAESRLGADYDLTVLGIERDGTVEMDLRGDTELLAGDQLLLQGPLDQLIRARDRLGLSLEAEGSLEMAERAGEDIALFEALLAPHSRLAGRTLVEVRFRERYGFTILAVSHQGAMITRKMRDVRLAFGDTLLLQGPRAKMFELEREDFLVLEPVPEEEKIRHDKAPLALAILVLVVALGTATGFGVATAMVTGAVLMVLLGCLTMDEAFQSIEWRSVFLIAAMLPLGVAMENSGTASFLAEGMVGLLGDLGPRAILGGLFVLSTLLTQPMSNAASTLLVAPIAMDIAEQLGASPYPFVLVVVIACSTAFLTPVGHQSNILVFGPGSYRFVDFTKVGAPLTATLFVVTMLTLPLIWPLFP